MIIELSAKLVWCMYLPDNKEFNKLLIGADNFQVFKNSGKTVPVLLGILPSKGKSEQRWRSRMGAM